jgi:hypothetical protein
MRTVKRLFSLCLLVLGMATPATATTIVFTDRAAFEAATQGADVTLTFNEPTLCVPGGFDPQFFCVADYGWVAVMYDMAAVGPGTAPPFIPVHLLSAFVDFAEPSMGFGFDVTALPNTTFFPPDAPLSIGLGISTTDGTYSTSMLLPLGTSFLGFVSLNTRFTGFQASPSTATVAIDNMVVQVPDGSSTLGLLFIAIASLGLVSARRNRARTI